MTHEWYCPRSIYPDGECACGLGNRADEGVYYTPREVIDAKGDYLAAIGNPPFVSPESASDVYLRTNQVMN